MNNYQFTGVQRNLYKKIHNVAAQDLQLYFVYTLWNWIWINLSYIKYLQNDLNYLLNISFMYFYCIKHLKDKLQNKNAM